MKDILKKFPLIAAIRNKEGFENALKSPCKILFLLVSDFNTVSAVLKRAKQFEKTLFMHIVCCDSLGKDLSGIKFLKLAGATAASTAKPELWLCKCA